MLELNNLNNIFLKNCIQTHELYENKMYYSVTFML